MKSPIALFAFNRPGHLDQMLAALAQNDGATDHTVYGFSDGPRSPADHKSISQVRAILAAWRARRVFQDLIIVERKENLGLATSIISGVTSLCKEHGHIVVLEDDLITSPHFLSYMQSALELYASDTAVASIHGYAFPMGERLSESYFLAGADCWGWGTWSRAWCRFEPDGLKLLAELRRRRLCYSFDVDGAYPYTRMLKRQIAGLNNSWAIRWRASTFLSGMVSLHPSRSLVVNAGLDGSGTHCPTSNSFATALSGSPIRIQRQEAVESPLARRALGRYFRSIAGPRGRLRCAAADVQHKLQSLLLGKPEERKPS